MEIEHLLALHPFVVDLSNEQILALARCAAPVRYAPGELLFRRGDNADAFHLMRAGQVALQLPAPDGPLVVEVVEGEQVLGWSWLVPPHRWRFDAAAMDVVDAIRLDAACLRALLREDPDLSSRVTRRMLVVLSDRVEHARVRLLDADRHHAHAG